MVTISVTVGSVSLCMRELSGSKAPSLFSGAQRKGNSAFLVRPGCRSGWRRGKVCLLSLRSKPHFLNSQGFALLFDVFPLFPALQSEGPRRAEDCWSRTLPLGGEQVTFLLGPSMFQSSSHFLEFLPPSPPHLSLPVVSGVCVLRKCRASIPTSRGAMETSPVTSLLLPSVYALVLVTSIPTSHPLGFRHLNPRPVEALMVDAPLLILNIHFRLWFLFWSCYKTPSSCGGTFPWQSPPDFPGLKCGGPFSAISVLYCCVFIMGLGEHGARKQAPPPTPLLGVDFGKFQVLGLWSVQWKNDTHFLGSWWSSKWNDVPTPPGMQSCRFLFPSLSVNPILPLLLAHFHLPFPKPGLHTWLWAHLSLSLACPAVFPDSCEPLFLHSLYKLRRNPSERKELAHTLKVSCKHFAEHNDAEPIVSRQMLVALRQCEGRLALWTQVEAHLLASTRTYLSELGRAFTVLCGFRKRRR